MNSENEDLAAASNLSKDSDADFRGIEGDRSERGTQPQTDGAMGGRGSNNGGQSQEGGRAA